MRRVIPALFAIARLALPCECVEATQPQAFRTAKTVFQGVVADVHYLDPENKPGGGVRVLVTFNVDRQWKGQVRPAAKVHAWESALLCDSYLFVKGERYLIYTVEEKSEDGWADRYPAGTRILTVGTCILRVKTGDDLPEERKILGPGNRPSAIIPRR